MVPSEMADPVNNSAQRRCNRGRLTYSWLKRYPRRAADLTAKKHRNCPFLRSSAGTPGSDRHRHIVLPRAVQLSPRCQGYCHKIVRSAGDLLVRLQRRNVRRET